MECAAFLVLHLHRLFILLPGSVFPSCSVYSMVVAEAITTEYTEYTESTEDRTHGIRGIYGTKPEGALRIAD